MVYKRRLRTSNENVRNNYRRLTVCRSLGFTGFDFDGGGSESDTESVVDSEPDDELDDVFEEDDDEEDDVEERDEDEGERFLFLGTAP